MGSYSSSRRQSRTPLGVLAKSQQEPGSPSPRAIMSHLHLEHLIQDLNMDLETYGVEEFRDGFFDAMFFKPPTTDQDCLLKKAEETLPAAFRKRHPLSPANFIPKQVQEIKGVVRQVATTRAGIKIAKSFSAFFMAYILCLVPITGSWLGRYNYVIALSAIMNHPGRTVGAQVDGAFLTIMGTASGLGWSAFALWLSNSSSVAASGYGGILAAFLVIFMGTIAAARSYFVRVYQLVLCTGISIIFTCLADISRTVNWSKLLDFGIPWLLGQAICLVICCTVFPDAGARPLAVALHDALSVMEDALIVPRVDNKKSHRQLAWTFVNLSQAYQDLALHISITRFLPADVGSLRNLMQGVKRSMFALKTDTNIFEDLDLVEQHIEGEGDCVIYVEGGSCNLCLKKMSSEDQAVGFIVNKLADPTRELLSCMRSALSSCDTALMDISGYRKYLGPPAEVSPDVFGIVTRIRKAMIKFNEEDDAFMENLEMSATFSDHPELVKLFLFMNPVRQATDKTKALLVKVMEMQQRRRGWRMYRPSYPFAKSLQRTNAQVRHDRGGLTAGFFFRSQEQLNLMMHDLQRSFYQPAPRHRDAMGANPPDFSYAEEDIVMDWETAGKTRFAYFCLFQLGWTKAEIGTQNESWWAVVIAWIMLHPRVGGNFKDLITRSLVGLLGAAWGGFVYTAVNGNPHAIAAFSAIYMIPMIYRFTQSTHPRSGIAGCCISLTVVSLNAYNMEGSLPVVVIISRYGAAFVVGIVSAVAVNWILWPFVARHELRKSISAMMFHLAMIYSGVVAKYIYYEDGEAPGKDDITRSELLEARLQEGFFRIRELMALTRHEIRLRGPFNALPYSALIENCESFFEHLIEVRQASLFFHPNYMSDNKQASEALLPFRRDAVAAILMKLYIIAGALRGNRKIPRYLPSAAAARKRLLDRMAEVETELAGVRSGFPVPKRGIGRKFAEVYQFAYSQALTQFVEQLEQLQKYTGVICGEVGFDPIVEDQEIT